MGVPAYHFIEPKPGYVTEYESAYVLPILERERYQHDGPRREQEIAQESKGKPKDSLNSWKCMEESLSEMSKFGLETILSTAALNAVRDRLLDQEIEYLYKIFKERLQLPIDQLKVSDQQKAEERQIRRLCCKFIAACDQAKGSADTNE
jgi:hypothetical protein